MCRKYRRCISFFLIYIIKQEIVMRRLILETPRLQLCEMVLDDFKSLSLILQDENVMYAYNGAFSEEETMAQ